MDARSAFDSRHRSDADRRRGLPAWLAPTAMAGLLVAAALGTSAVWERSAGIGRVETADPIGARPGDEGRGAAVAALSAPASPTTTPPVAVDRPGPDRPEYADAIWPSAAYSFRYDDPGQAVRGFALQVARFDHPRLGPFVALDGRRGEIVVRPYREGPATMVLVEQLGDEDSWWVTGARGEHLVVDEPWPGQGIGSPLHLAGSAWAASGTVEVEIRADRRPLPLHQKDFVTGGGEELLWFEAQFGWSSPGGGRGVVLFTTRHPGTGQVEEVTAIRVSFLPLPPG